MAKIPRVTEVLSTFSNFRHVPAKVLDKAAERGTAVHALCSGVAKGAWIPSEMVDENLRGYYESFLLWKDAQVKDFRIVEKRYSSELGYTGQIDAVIEAKDGKLYLIDYKTSERHQPTYPIQMAAYDQLLREEWARVDGAMLVYLSKAGEFPDIHVMHEFATERDVWFSALTCWKYFNQRKGRKKYGAKEPVSENSGDNVRTGLHTEGIE